VSRRVDSAPRSGNLFPTGSSRTARLIAVSVCVAASVLLSACTTPEPHPGPHGGRPSASSSVPPADVPSDTPQGTDTASTPNSTSSGQFVSQAAVTSGTATLVENPDQSISLTLTDFSTEDRPDIRMYLNSDPVVLDVDGFFKVIDGPSSTGHLEIGHLSSAIGDQTYDLTSSRRSLRSTLSLTLYDYDAREALGSVNIGPIGQPFTVATDESSFRAPTKSSEEAGYSKPR